MKTIIVVQGRSGIGKTPAIVEVFEKFKNSPAQYEIVDGPEYRGKNKARTKMMLNGVDLNEQFAKGMAGLIRRLLYSWRRLSVSSISKCN
jgi:Cdc6-like AAA superfamily ATPase